jgi:MFS family permease
MGYYFSALGGALIGTSTSNHVGRRPMLMFGNIGMAIIIAGLAGCTAHYHSDQPMSLSRFTIALIFLVGVFHAGAINPLVIAFPAEVLHTNIRGKGMGINQFCVHVAELLNDYAIPIALKAISWRTYIIFACWNVVQTLWIYYFFVETKGHTLEEMDFIFEAKYPVKESLRKHAPAEEVLQRQSV